MQDAGIDPDRIYQVSGKAASDPLFPDDPSLPGNRRIAIVLFYPRSTRIRNMELQRSIAVCKRIQPQKTVAL